MYYDRTALLIHVSKRPTRLYSYSPCKLCSSIRCRDVADIKFLYVACTATIFFVQSLTAPRCKPWWKCCIWLCNMFFIVFSFSLHTLILSLLFLLCRNAHLASDARSMAEAAQARKKTEPKHDIPSGAEAIGAFLWLRWLVLLKFAFSFSFEAPSFPGTGPDSKWKPLRSAFISKRRHSIQRHICLWIQFSPRTWFELSSERSSPKIDGS